MFKNAAVLALAREDICWHRPPHACSYRMARVGLALGGSLRGGSTSDAALAQVRSVSPLLSTASGTGCPGTLHARLLALPLRLSKLQGHMGFSVRSGRLLRLNMSVTLNHPASANGAITVLFHAGRSWRAVPEPGRSSSQKII